MEILTVDGLVQIAKSIGLPGLLLVLWYISNRDLQRLLQKYYADVNEVRQMYENNVKLCETAIRIAEQQQDVIIMNTRTMQKLVDRIDSNQFCPLVRMKRIEGVKDE